MPSISTCLSGRYHAGMPALRSLLLAPLLLIACGEDSAEAPAEEATPRSVEVDAGRSLAPGESDALAAEDPTPDAGLDQDAGDADAAELSDAAPLEADATPDPDAPDAFTPEVTDGGLVCGELSAAAVAAQRPVDIVWIIDGSPSMDDEITLIEENLNAFAQRIGEGGLDYRVVIIGADREYCEGGHCYFEICVPPPLSGAQACPDVDSDRFRHVRTGVHSADALDVAAATLPQWQDFMRPEAAQHLIFVTDDDQGWGLDADEFMALLAPPAFGEVRVHSIVDEIGRLPSCGLFGEPECSCGEERGQTYIDMSERTQGLVRSICEEDWDPIFNALEENVVEGAGIPCAFDLPELPNGLEFDPERVNVERVRGEGVQLLDQVPPGECEGGPGWHYDEAANPTRLHLCPNSCGGAGEVRIELGCETRKR